MTDVSKLSREELVNRSRSMESKINVLRANALRSDRFQKSLDEAENDFQEISGQLRKMDEEETVDLEGTSPTLADAHGNFAKDAKTARIGGAGINDSNTNPDQAKRHMPAENVDEAQKRAEDNQQKSEPQKSEPQKSGPQQQPQKK